MKNNSKDKYPLDFVIMFKNSIFGNFDWKYCVILKINIGYISSDM